MSSQSISTTLPRAFDLGKELPENLESASLKGAPSSPTSNAKHTFPVTSDGGFSFVPPGSIQSNRSDTSRTNSSNAHFPGVPLGNFSHAKQAAGSSMAFSSSGKTSYSGGQSASIGPVIAHPLPAIRSSVSSSQQNFAPVNSSKDKFQPNKENYRAASPTRLLNTEPQLSKQFGNVGELFSVFHFEEHVFSWCHHVLFLLFFLFAALLSFVYFVLFRLSASVLLQES